MTRPRRSLCMALSIVLAGILSIYVVDGLSQSNEDCLRCHWEQEAAPFVDASIFEASIHGELSCTSCHWAVTQVPHIDPEVRRELVPDMCGSCHSETADLLSRGAHGRALERGVENAAVCTDCHGAHEVRPPSELASPTNRLNISETCARCHATMVIKTKPGIKVNPVSTHRKSYHGLAARFGSAEVANCASCHGYHKVLPSTDPDSPVSKGNLSETCGQCHTGAGPRLAQGNFHSTPSTSSTGIVRYVFIFYVLLIVLVVGGMLLHNFADLVRRISSRFRTIESRETIVKPMLSDRIQYIGIQVSFAILAYTGFALRFPEAWWTWPLRLFENPEQIRRILHRAGGVAFVSLAIYHLLFVLLTRRGREKHRELRPHLQDGKDLLALTGYNLGLSERRPTFLRYCYVKKSEYWTLVWGFVVILISGLFLAFNNFTLRQFPLWVSELARTVHFYEALLAILSGVVWHLYWMIFDPHKLAVRTPRTERRFAGRARDARKGSQKKAGKNSSGVAKEKREED